MEVDEIDENEKLSNIEDNATSASTNSKCDATTGDMRSGQANNDIVSLLSDSDDEDTNDNGATRGNHGQPMVYFKNDEVMLKLINPSIAELGSNNNDSSIVMLDTAENWIEQSVQRTHNSQQPIEMQEDYNIHHTDLTPNFESVATNFVDSLPSNELQHNESTDNDDKTTRTKQECINPLCVPTKEPALLCEAPLWALNYFNVPFKSGRRQFVCQNCFDTSINDYERMCTALVNQQPLLLEQLPVRPEVVKIVDSEEEDNDDNIDCAEPLPSETLSLLEEHLDVAMKETVLRLNIQQQTLWANQILEHKLEMNSTISDAIDEQINSIHRVSDSMYKNLYKNKKCLIEELPPFDLNANQELHMYGPDYPPRGEIVFPPVDMHSLYYAVRANLLSAWTPCKVTEHIVDPVDGKPMFKVRFYRCNEDRHKTVSGNHLAYGRAPGVRLRVGARVIALPMQKTTDTSFSMYHPGIIAETLEASNRWRYLIFFDDSSVRYVTPDNIRLICSPSPNVWDDVHPDAAEFIKSYLEQYKTERPMVQVQRGQKMITEWNSEWTSARVVDIDGSLLLMHFDSVRRWEWIYRGSTRLGPLYKDQQLQKRYAAVSKANEPFVEHITIDDDDESEYCSETTTQSVQPENVSDTKPSEVDPELAQKHRSVSKKSTVTMPSHAIVLHMKNVPTTTTTKSVQPEPETSLDTNPITLPSTSKSVQPKTSSDTDTNPISIPSTSQADTDIRSVSTNSSVPSRPAIHHMNNSTIYIDEDNRSKGKVVQYSVRKHIQPRKYVQHICGATCLCDQKYDLSPYSPLAKPLLSGWERKVLNLKTKKCIVYRTPCGRTLRNMHEVHIYLRATKCSLNVDNFDFGIMTSCLAEYVSDGCSIKKKDLSDGCEAMPVSVENYYDNTMPPPCVYSAERTPTEGVPLNLDPNFLCGCDCGDDCWDKTKCQCWKLTIDGAQFISPSAPIGRIGYEFKRLIDNTPTGIYECNSQCKCSKTCLNRVAQHPLQLKLQVFKTISRGWGLRCLNDVPLGGFVCVYTGDMLTDKNANIAGSCYGDEYFADLDYIEIVENLKEGYEPEAMDECNTPSAADGSNENNDIKSTTLKVEPTFNSDEDELQRLPSFDVNSSSISVARSNSIFRFYDPNEKLFTMDAKKQGNIGRYINHSCEPNMIVQSVFVDTHDLRFPWVAFFAKSHIPAGTELTWDYSYVVGSVPGKVLFCECGAKNCRHRIL